MREFGTLTFAGTDLTQYGITISGDATYNAPERDIQKFEVPGRNGDLIVDNGRFKNIIVKYYANIEENFPSVSKSLREFLMAHQGYYKLSDSYHPNEYRIAQYVGPMDFDEIGQMNEWGQIVLEFDCKPQRFLTSGDTPVSFVAEPYSHPTIYEFDDFSSYVQSDVLTPGIKEAKYTTSQINSMEYLIITVNMPADDAVIKFEKADNYKFFASCMDVNPLTYSSGSISYVTQTDKSFAWNDTMYGNILYIVVQRSMYLRMYVDNVLVYDYKVFDEQSLTNNTSFSSKPILKLTLGDEIEDDYICGINDCSIRLANNDATIGSVSVLTIDADTMNAYSLPADNKNKRLINCNKYVKFSEYDIILNPGTNKILVTDYVSSLQIIPKWWTI